MERTPVTSAAIIAKGYNALTREMDLEFHNGTTGAFSGVSQEDSTWLIVNKVLVKQCGHSIEVGIALQKQRSKGYYHYNCSIGPRGCPHRLSAEYPKVY